VKIKTLFGQFEYIFSLFVSDFYAFNRNKNR
jgi:hypothetical protein